MYLITLKRNYNVNCNRGNGKEGVEITIPTGRMKCLEEDASHCPSVTPLIRSHPTMDKHWSE